MHMYICIPHAAKLLYYFFSSIFICSSRNIALDFFFYIFFALFFLQDMLPDYIHMRVAESILFAGKAVRVLRNPSPAFRFKDVTQNLLIPKGSQRIQGMMGCFSFHKEPFADTELIDEELLPRPEADKIETMLQNLKVHVPCFCYTLYARRWFL